MGFKQWDKERYNEYLKDVDIARKELVDMKLFPEHNILCDLYAIPSHNFQAYYAVVYENKGRLHMVYAKPEIYVEHSVVPIKMYPFEYVKAAEMHSVAESRIIIGIKTLSTKFSTLIRDIVCNIPSEHILGENLVCIDGVFQAVRVFEESKVVKQIVYRMADKIAFPKGKEYLREVLEELYLDVGKIIGHENTKEQEFILKQ